MQITVRRNWYANKRPKERGVCVEKRGRKVALRHEVLRSVEILEAQTQQLGALNDAGFDEAPIVRRNQQRNDVDLPRSICAERITVDVVGDSVLANAALGTAPASSQFFGADLPERLHQVRPVRSRSHPIGRQFIVGGSRSGAKFDTDPRSWDETPFLG